MADPPKLFLTEAEAAAMLTLSPRTLQRMRLDGGGPPFVQLTERRIAYRLAALEAWAAERGATSTSAATVAAGERAA